MRFKKVDMAWQYCLKADKAVQDLLSKAEYARNEELAKAFEAVHKMLVECRIILFHCYQQMKE